MSGMSIAEGIARGRRELGITQAAIVERREELLDRLGARGGAPLSFCLPVSTRTAPRASPTHRSA